MGSVSVNGWKRLDHLQDYKPVGPTDSVGYLKFVEQVQVFKFLEGLNVEFDPVWSRVLGMDVFLSLQEAFAHVQNEKSYCSAMLPSAFSDRSALVSAPSRDGDRGSCPPSEKDTLFCDYCRCPRHTRETCRKLHGPPSGGHGDRSGSRGGRSGQSRGRGPNACTHHSNTIKPQSPSSVVCSVDIFGFSTSELEVALLNLLDRRASSSSSDHMPGSSDLFSAYILSSGHDKVRIADVTLYQGRPMAVASPS
ncbi:hypothetical protein CsSME_00021194 [Camellia sinensis var. sinensis]